MNRTFTVYRLGRVEYEDGLKLQELFGQARKADLIDDALLLLEHSPVLTLGRSGKRSNIVTGADDLERMGIDVFETNRGGDVTYHGPGQIVGYPIFKLPPERHDVRRYVRDVEEVMVRTCAEFGITAGRINKWPGVWLGDETSPDARKIAAIGIHIARWQTSHGFALNVNTDLGHFKLIVPCGIEGKGVTSISREAGSRIDVSRVEDAVVRHFAELFEMTPREARPERKTISVIVTRGQGSELQVLLLKRRPERGGFWQPITGRVEADESALAAASREAREETGRALDVHALDYVHSFAFGDEVPPSLFEETAFAARWPDGGSEDPTLDAREHESFEWVTPEVARARLPFAGLKVALRRGIRELT